MNSAHYFLGLISGTSVDAIDVVLLNMHPKPQIVRSYSHAYPTDLQQAILKLSQSDGLVQMDTLGQLDVQIGHAFAQAANSLLQMHHIDRRHVAAIGSHGQTIRHRPHLPHAFTWQMGDPNVIAEKTGITVVADFRRRDVAAGGEGAPMVPAFHHALFHHSQENRAVLNLGGIANLTLLPSNDVVRGFDTGPANALLDAITQQYVQKARDEGGQLAAQGNIQQEWLRILLQDAYFQKLPPKSTGREHLHHTWLEQHLGDLDIKNPTDLLTTLTELSAITIAQALKNTQPETSKLIAAGGGVHNAHLMQRIAHHVAPITLQTSQDYGIDPDFVEAAAFAWLAYQTLNQQNGNIPTVTGASGSRVLGGIYAA